MGIQFDILLSFSIWPYITKFSESLIPTSTQGISCSRVERDPEDLDALSQLLR